jgi:hypothetical protein
LFLDDAESTLVDGVIEKGVALNGGVVYGLKSTVIVIDSEVRDHVVSGKASAILLLNGILQMEQVNMLNNSAAKGALVCTGESDIYVIGSKFIDNSGGAISAGFQMKKDRASFKNNIFENKNLVVDKKVANKIFGWFM